MYNCNRINRLVRKIIILIRNGNKLQKGKSQNNYEFTLMAYYQNWKQYILPGEHSSFSFRYYFAVVDAKTNYP